MSIGFNGSTDYITWGDVAALDSLTKLTVSMWLYNDGFSAANYHGFIHKYNDDGAGDQGWGMVCQAGISIQDLILFARNGDFSTAYTGAGPLTVNTWHHVHWIYDGTQATNSSRLRLWIDAVEQPLTFAGIVATSLPNVANPLTLGRNIAQYMTGQMAEVGVWTGVAITDAETIFPLSFGFTPEHFVPQSLEFYAPLVRGIYDEYGGATPSTTGTSVNDHPRNIMPGVPRAVVASGFRGVRMFGGN
jgi:hypothetical protein